MVKKYPKNVMTLPQCGLDELIRAVTGVGLVRADVNLDGKEHWLAIGYLFSTEGVMKFYIVR